MRRLFAIAASLAALLILLAAPAALAAEPTTTTGSFVLSAHGSVDIPADRQIETLVVLDGTADIAGEVRTLVVAGGTARLDGATVRTLIVVDGSAELIGGTVVRGDVYTLDATVVQAAGTEVGGTVRGLEGDLGAFAIAMIPIVIVLFVGFALAALVVGLLVAAFGARQVRTVEALIERQPGQVLVAGIVGTIALPALAFLLMVTVVGAPVGFGLLFVALPALAFLGWLVAAIWVGDWLLGRMRGTREAGRPYLASVLGIIVLSIAGVLPFVTAIATLFGFGGVVLAGWRVLRPETPPAAPAGAPLPEPTAA